MTYICPKINERCWRDKPPTKKQAKLCDRHCQRLKEIKKVKTTR